MIAYLAKFRGAQPVIHNLDESLQIRTQTSSQTNPYGKNKFKYGFETVWLLVRRPGNSNVLLARVSETGKDAKGHMQLEFVPLTDLDDHAALVEMHIDKLTELVA
jgi:hypothetical protein